MEDLTLELLRCPAQGIADVGKAREERSGVLRRAGIRLGRFEGAKLDFSRLLAATQLLDALADELRLDPALKRLDLQSDPPVEVRDLVAQTLLDPLSASGCRGSADRRAPNGGGDSSRCEPILLPDPRAGRFAATF